MTMTVRAPDPIVSRCPQCQVPYSLVDFLSLPPPDNARGLGKGVLLRSCATPACAATLEAPFPNEPRRPMRGVRLLPAPPSKIGKHGAIAFWTDPGVWAGRHQGRPFEIRQTPSGWRIDGQYRSHISAQAALDTVGAP